MEHTLELLVVPIKGNFMAYCQHFILLSHENINLKASVYDMLITHLDTH